MSKKVLNSTEIILSNNLAYLNIDEVIEKVKEINPRLSEFDIISGINLAKRLLFKKEYLTDEIKKRIKNVEFDLIMGRIELYIIYVIKCQLKKILKNTTSQYL